MLWGTLLVLQGALLVLQGSLLVLQGALLLGSLIECLVVKWETLCVWNICSTSALHSFEHAPSDDAPLSFNVFISVIYNYIL